MAYENTFFLSEKIKRHILFVENNSQEKNKLDAATLTLLLNASAKTKSFQFGANIINQFMSGEFFDRKNKNVTLLNSLIHFYGECCVLANVRAIWDILKKEALDMVQKQKFSPILDGCAEN